MNTFILLAFLFFMGSLIGWCLEVVYRRFFSAANPKRRWINPGFLTGPYLPLYGFGLTLLYLIACCEQYSGVSSPALRKTGAVYVHGGVYDGYRVHSGRDFHPGHEH